MPFAARRVRPIVLALAALAVLPMLAKHHPEAPTIDESRLGVLNDNTHRAERRAALDTVMIHFMSNVVANRADPFDIDDCVGIFNRYGVSAHFIIGRDGTIFRLLPDSATGFHAGRVDPAQADDPRMKQMNDRSVGIELLAIGSKREMGIYLTAAEYDELVRRNPEFVGYTDAQYDAVTWLVRRLAADHEAIELTREHVIGHDEYAGNRKNDPGELFDWSRLGLAEGPE